MAQRRLGIQFLGSGRSTRYAVPQALLGRAAQQPLHWVHENGRVERWGTLGEAGVPVAEATVFETKRRTYLESVRFDRVGAQGRRHAVPLHAVHQAFVAGPRQHWVATVEILVQQRRMPFGSAAQVQALRHFGRLIGNTDMHLGNLSPAVQAADVARGRFSLAPLYDMLPMRWRPDASTGELALTPFEPEAVDLQSAARPWALRFWEAAAGHMALSRDFRRLAVTMASRLAS